MAKFLDKSQEEWDALVEKWHTDNTIDCSLRDYLGLSDVEYIKFVHGIRDTDISDEDVYKRSSEVVKDAVTELVIKPKISAAFNCIKQ